MDMQIVYYTKNPLNLSIYFQMKHSFDSNIWFVNDFFLFRLNYQFKIRLAALKLIRLYFNFIEKKFQQKTHSVSLYQTKK